MNSVDAYRQGDVVGGTLNLVGAGFGLNSAFVRHAQLAHLAGGPRRLHPRAGAVRFGSGDANRPVSRTLYGPEHGKGNVAHNNAIEDLLDDAKARGATDLRKNRVQRDASSERVFTSDGRFTRPDASYIEDGVRYNFNRVSNSADIDREIEAFMRMIDADPRAVSILEF